MVVAMVTKKGKSKFKEILEVLLGGPVMFDEHSATPPKAFDPDQWGPTGGAKVKLAKQPAAYKSMEEYEAAMYANVPKPTMAMSKAPQYPLYTSVATMTFFAVSSCSNWPEPSQAPLAQADYDPESVEGPTDDGDTEEPQTENSVLVKGGAPVRDPKPGARKLRM
jgi:hypothetical protein